MNQGIGESNNCTLKGSFFFFLLPSVARYAGIQTTLGYWSRIKCKFGKEQDLACFDEKSLLVGSLVTISARRLICILLIVYAAIVTNMTDMIPTSSYFSVATPSSLSCRSSFTLNHNDGISSINSTGIANLPNQVSSAAV